MGPTSVAPDEIKYLKPVEWDFLIVGADGQQGQITSQYLHNKGYKIVCVDLYTNNLKKLFNKNVPIIPCDCTDNKSFLNVINIYKPKVVINLTYQESLALVRVCLDKGISFLDVFANMNWFNPFFCDDEDFSIVELCKKNNCTVITGCGCAPGITSMLAKKLNDYFKNVNSVETGFAWDSNIKEYVPPFCVSDAAEELFYNTRIIKNSKEKSVEPLKYQKEYIFPLIGKQTVYAISHIELCTLYNFFAKKGIQNVTFFGGFPEHCINVLNVLRTLNLIKNKKEKLTIIGQEGSCNFTKQEILNVISKQIETPKDYTETEIIWCMVVGRDFNNEPLKKTMICKVPPIKGWEKFGCNVDTGIPAGIVAEMLYKKIFKPGAYSPEIIIPCDLFFNELEKFGFEFIIQETL